MKINNNAPQDLFLKIKEEVIHFSKNYDQKSPKFLLGLSGGPDSIFLFHVLLQCAREGVLELAVVHVNHGWRDEASSEEAFCRSLVLEHKIEFYVEHAKDYLEIKKNGSLEEVGRKIRLVAFSKIKSLSLSDIVCLAHHADDQVETFFIKLFRGASLQGLSGMAKFLRGFYRPLLEVPKKEILNYLDENKIRYCLDKSNNSSLFLRNRIRHDLLPKIELIEQRGLKKIITTMDCLGSEASLLHELVMEKFDKVILFEVALASWRINFALFKEYSLPLQLKLLEMLIFKVGFSGIISQSLLREIQRFIFNSKSIKHVVANLKIMKKKDLIFFFENKT